MANNYGIFFSTCSICKKCPSVSLLGLLTATASFPFFTEANVLKTQKHPVSSMFQTFSGFHPLISSLDRSFQLASVCGLISASSPATVIVEMLCPFFKRSNHWKQQIHQHVAFQLLLRLPLGALSQRLEYWRTCKDNTTSKPPR